MDQEWVLFKIRTIHGLQLPRILWHLWNEIRYLLFVSLFFQTSTLTYFLDVVSMSQIVNGKDFSDLSSPNFCKYNMTNGSI